MKIGLQNFQGIGAYTEIPIAPITLFYGPNSAGKSTVADAFEFLSRTLSGKNQENWKKDLDKHARRNRKERSLSEGYIGDPADVVFTVEGSVPDIESGQWARDHWGPSRKDDVWGDHSWIKELNGLDQVFVEGKKFDYQIHFAEVDGKLRLSRSLLTIDGQPLFKAENYTPSGFNFLGFNIRHPAYQKLDELDGLIRLIYNKEIETGYYYDCDDRLEEITDDKDICWLTFPYVKSGDPFSFSPEQWYDPERNDYFFGFTKEMKDQCGKMRGYLEFFLVLPAKWVSDSCDIHAVPPLRPFSEIRYTVPPHPYTDWHKRTAGRCASRHAWPDNDCWPHLAVDVCDRKFVKPEEIERSALSFINSILDSRDFLETGYIIDGDVKFNFLLDLDELSNFINLDPTSRQEALEKTPVIVDLYLKYQPEKFRVAIADVGVGISQVIPVLFGCWQAMNGQYNVHIQQPELHLHPKLQAQLADVFIKCVNESESCRIFLLESHSEHLLLRLLRRIRETNQTENPTGNVLDIGKARSRSLNAEQVSVVYVKKDKNGLTTMKPLRLADDGEFIDRWPDGFFTDRDIELFGEEGPFA
jgi:predicted ATPase